MKFVRGMRDLVHEYDVFLLDMWGVMHDGQKPYDGVLDVVQQLKQHTTSSSDQPKRLIILSNSSKRKDHSMKMLTKLGFDPNDFTQILTSGEIAHHILSAHGTTDDPVTETTNEWHWDVLTEHLESTNNKARKVFVLGSGDGDADYCTSCGWELAPVDEASLIVARGTFTIDNGQTVVEKRVSEKEYDRVLQECLEQAASLQLPMLVCNPDKIRPDADKSPMPGQLGDLYEEALQSKQGLDGSSAERLVKRIGKPFADVYRIALQSESDQTVDLSRVCMVGDALETDVAGGSAVGIDTIWILKDGIYGDQLESIAQEKQKNGKDQDTALVHAAVEITSSFNSLPAHETYAKGRQLEPTVLMPHFRW